ncbi:microsomal glutathione S-transferase 1-like [Chrysoperla carnea]|uniref:microsomal glutathione S-transferase 1-like n=1 Tax=Chrysoperla carnea TaxID=189513 RepID=UPI001D079394|nr:microsomal glutathione S-transferase 1-like [Chrysoperla carnea]
MDTKLFENPIFRAYIFYGCLLTLKTIGMVFLIAKYRFKKQIFISPEDTKMFLVKENATVTYDDPDIERCRRAHLNDLENIPFFMFVSFFYVLTDPNPIIAINLFRIYTTVRFIYTFVYAVIVVPQPARSISWTIGFWITMYITISTAIHFW